MLTDDSLLLEHINNVHSVMLYAFFSVLFSFELICAHVLRRQDYTYVFEFIENYSVISGVPSFLTLLTTKSKENQ